MFPLLERLRERRGAGALGDLSDLTEEERVALDRIVLSFRRSRRSRRGDEGFARFWDNVCARRTPMSDEEAEEIANEAVAFASFPPASF